MFLFISSSISPEDLCSKSDNLLQNLCTIPAKEAKMLFFWWLACLPQFASVLRCPHGILSVLSHGFNSVRKVPRVQRGSLSVARVPDIPRPSQTTKGMLEAAQGSRRLLTMLGPVQGMATLSRCTKSWTKNTTTPWWRQCRRPRLALIERFPVTFHFEKMYHSVGVLKRAVVLQCEQLEVLGLTQGSSPGLDRCWWDI